MPFDYHFVDKTKCSNTAEEIIQAAGNKDWIFSGETGTLLVFYKKRKTESISRKTKEMEEMYYNKNKILGLCSYAFDKDFKELYEAWRDERKKNPQAKFFTERSESLFFGKFKGQPKRVAIAMLEKAIELKHLSVYPLNEVERNKIIAELRLEKEKEEKANNKILTKKEESLALEKKKAIDLIIQSRGEELEELARQEVLKEYPDLTGGRLKSTIYIKKRMLASNIYENEEQNK